MVLCEFFICFLHSLMTLFCSFCLINNRVSWTVLGRMNTKKKDQVMLKSHIPVVGLQKRNPICSSVLVTSPYSLILYAVLFWSSQLYRALSWVTVVSRLEQVWQFSFDFSAPRCILMFLFCWGFFGTILCKPYR